MARIRGHGNKSTEALVAKLLRTAGFTGWRRRFPFFGNPDFVFRKKKLAIFIDGCFWHGCLNHCRMPSSNVAYWKRKIACNRDRDRLVVKTLQKKNWRVLRIWEHELKGKNESRLLRRIYRALEL
ncbi:MAG: very short patch repair endonuclease [Limisphaerales bacterium]